MRAATFWDLLAPFHYSVIIFFIIVLVLEGLFLKRMVRKRKLIFSLLAIVMIFSTLMFGFIVRAILFPGGPLNDTQSRSDRVMISMIQGYLVEYKSNCDTFPTTEQGLKALAEKSSGAKCPNYIAPMKGFPNRLNDLKYISDGTRYEIETTGNYGIQGLIVRGTNEVPSTFFIREK